MSRASSRCNSIDHFENDSNNIGIESSALESMLLTRIDCRESSKEQGKGSLQESNQRQSKTVDDSTPGPANYYPDYRFSSIYPTAPSYTCPGRPHDPYGYYLPGPGTYTTPSIECYKRRAPSSTFGTKHSWKKAVFTVTRQN